MLNVRKLVLFICAAMVSILAQAQNATETTDIMRSEGKIYVVLAVVLTIVIGLILYVIRLDRKITKLENKEDI